MRTLRRSPRRAAGRALLAVLVSTLLAPPPPVAAGEKGTPEAFCKRFQATFAQKDYDALRSYFAPGATVAAMWLAEKPEPETSTADEWTRSVEQAMTAVEIAIEVEETSVLSFDHGTVVSLRFRADGIMGGEHHFTNNGIDTFVLTDAGDEWKILHYSYIELLEMSGAS